MKEINFTKKEVKELKAITAAEIRKNELQLGIYKNFYQTIKDERELEKYLRELNRILNKLSLF